MRQLYSCPFQKFAGCFQQCCKSLSRLNGNYEMATLLSSYNEIQTTKTRNSVPLKTKQSIGTTYDRSKKIPHWNFTAKGIATSGKKSLILRNFMFKPENVEQTKYSASIKMEEPLWKDTLFWKISMLRNSVKKKYFHKRDFVK